MGARHTFKAIAAALAMGFLLLLGATTGSAFAHEVQHAGHHSPGMHGTGICAWMCAAGQSLEGVAVDFQVARDLLALTDLPVTQKPLSAVRLTSVARGPPPFSI
nr:hypothetical protein [Nitrospirota bacterium]